MLHYETSTAPPSSTSASGQTASPSNAPSVPLCELVVMRGCSGSGKSSLAKKLVLDRVALFPTSRTAIFSTDDFWMVPSDDGLSMVYKHDASRLGEAHQWNQARAIAAMESKNADYIIIDNTNLGLWEMRPYVEAAVRLNYLVSAREPDTSWWISRDPQALFERSTHNVPLEVIQRMVDRFEEGFSVDAVLNCPPPKQQRRRPQDAEKGGFHQRRNFDNTKGRF